MFTYYELKISTNHFNNFAIIHPLLRPLLITSQISLPKKCKKFVVIKSPHVNKKSKEHFQACKYTKIYLISFSIDELKNFLLHAPNNLWVRVKKREVYCL
jgi:hypothetical protein